MDIAEKHKQSKKKGYWGDLSIGSTTGYKTAKIEELIRRFFQPECSSILDIGSGGNCDHILKYRGLLGAKKIACLDYDEKIIEEMKKKFPNEGIQWHVADIFKLSDFKEGFDLVFLLDILHEVYSFYGRSSRKENEPVSANHGLEYVVSALRNIANITNTGGGMIITDNILPSKKGKVVVRAKTEEMSQVVDYFFKNYPTRRFNGVSKERDKITLSPADLSVLLTQYNKIKKKDWARWKVERFEQHQYMTKEQYERTFSDLGFRTHMIIETPSYIHEEWDRDFEIVSGLENFPLKRVTLLAIKETSTPEVDDVIRLQDDANRVNGKIESEHHEVRKI